MKDTIVYSIYQEKKMKTKLALGNFNRKGTDPNVF